MTRYIMLTMLCAAAAAGAAPVERASDDSGTIYLGAIADQDWGRPVTSGDLDGDGYDEIIVAASVSWGTVTSRVYVVRGGPDGARRGTVNLMTSGADQEIIAEVADDNLGCSMATGDVNGDGIDDLVLCASTSSVGGLAGSGTAYLILGGPDFFDSPTRDLSVDGSWHTRIVGPVEGGDLGGANAFGGLDAHGVAIGNLDGDAKGDIVLGVHRANNASSLSGRVYAVFGTQIYPPAFYGFTLSLAIGNDYDVRIDGKGEYDELGDFVLTGDITGDGLDELIIADYNYSQATLAGEGAVLIFRGRTSWGSHYNLATTPADITLLGSRRYDGLGEAAAVGDFNGDGVLDLASAAPGAELGTLTTQRGDGLVYGLFGSTALQTGTHTISYATATPDFLLIGEKEENLGSELITGDFNGDGYADLAAGEWFAGPETNGVVEVLLGREFTGNPSFTAAVDTDLHIVGAAQDRISFSMGVADTNDDGRDEIVFGTPFNNGDYPDEAGTVYLASMPLGDFDLDGDIDSDDYAIILSSFGHAEGDPAFNPACDLDGDGIVTLVDYQLWLPLYRAFQPRDAGRATGAVRPSITQVDRRKLESTRKTP